VSSAAVQEALVAELRKLTADAKPNMREIRVAIGCGPAELAAAVQALRYQGKLAWDSLDLSESMKSAGDEGKSTPRPAEGPEPTAGMMPRRQCSGPDDEDDEDYPGGVNDIAEASLPEQGQQGIGPVPAEGPPGDGPAPVRHDEPPLPRGRVEEPRPGEPGGEPPGAEQCGQAAAGGAAARAPLGSSGGFVPKPMLRKAGVHAAQTRAAARPLPAPKHESEVARAVREEVEETRVRRRSATSTATVSRPLELRKFGVDDMSFAEGVASLLVEEPNNLMAAISRKHPVLWRRVILLGRRREERPAQALYAALERGLDELEAELSVEGEGEKHAA
jgi:hypothetical protein